MVHKLILTSKQKADLLTFIYSGEPKDYTGHASDAVRKIQDS